MATTTVNLIDQIGGKELKARYSDEADRATKDANGNTISSTYLTTSTGDTRYITKTDTNAGKANALKTAYEAGAGISITQNISDAQLKAVIATDLIETPIVAGTGMSIVDNTTDVEFSTLPDTITYVTGSPVMGASSALPLNMSSGQYASFTTLGQNSGLDLDNDTGITGLDTDKLYRCTTRVQATNTGSSMVVATISAPAWSSGNDSTVSAAVPAGATVILQMQWYSKGNSTLVPTATAVTDLNTGIVELTAEEVCDV